MISRDTSEKRMPLCAIDNPSDTDATGHSWGMPPAAERTWREMPVSRITRYPTLYASELKQALATYVGVTPDMIVTGCGSDDILDSAMRAFGEFSTSPDPVW